MIFTVERIVAQGGFGRVFLAKDDTENEIAVKEIFIGGVDHKEVEKTSKEVDLLSSLKHPCVIGYLGHEMRDENLLIFMEYAPHGTLGEMIEEKSQAKSAFTQKEIVDLFAQVVHAVVYIHEKGIIHRDIHVQNVLRGRGNRLKLCDFGISRRVKSESTEDGWKGRVSCLAPELIRGGTYSKESDMWSVGCLLYHTAALKPPFESPTIAGQIAAILSERSTDQLLVGFPEGGVGGLANRASNKSDSSSYSYQMMDLIRSLLASNSKRRPTAKSLTSHPLLVKAIHVTHLNVSPMAAPEGFEDFKNKFSQLF